MKNWQEKIREGMKLIIEGCKENSVNGCKGSSEWDKCRAECPFTILCDSIFCDSENSYTTPDCYEQEGLSI